MSGEYDQRDGPWECDNQMDIIDPVIPKNLCVKSGRNLPYPETAFPLPVAE